MHSCRRRYIGVFLDPVLACNLRCRMCFFSDDTMRAGMTGTISEERLALIEHAFFHRALKLQIGCGAEPTLYPRLAEIIARGKNAGVPYISLITNGQLIASGKVKPAGSCQSRPERDHSLHARHTPGNIRASDDRSKIQQSPDIIKYNTGYQKKNTQSSE